MSEMRYAIYTRFSTDMQKATSTEDQIRECRRCDRASSGIVLDDCIFSDEGLSGALPLDQRRELSALLKACEQLPRPFDVVLVESTSRLSRKDGEAVQIVETLQFNGVQVYFVTQGVDTSKPDWQMQVGIHGVMDADYRRKVGKATQRGMRGAVERGYSAGGRVYGYNSIPELDQTGAKDRKTGQTRVLGKRPEINPEQAAVVREIFSLWADGLSVINIAHRLNQRNYEPPHNSRQQKSGCRRPSWIPATIRLMLQNPKYIGDWTYGKTVWVKNPATGQRKRVPKPESNWVRNEVPELAIIDNGVWDAAQARIQTGKKGPQKRRRGPGTRHLFSGLARCHVCGSKYVVVSGTNQLQTIFQCCTNKQRGAAVCSNNFKVTEGELENKILSDIQRNLLSAPVLSGIVAKVNSKLKQKLAALRKQSSEILSENRELDKSIANIIKAIESGVSSDALLHRLREHEDRKRVVDAKIEALEHGLDFSRFKVDKQYVEKWLFRMQELVRTDPMAAKAKLTSLIGEFTLSPEMIDGARCLVVAGNAQLSGLLMVAAGGENLQYTKYRGADLNCRPPVPQTGALTN